MDLPFITRGLCLRRSGGWLWPTTMELHLANINRRPGGFTPWSIAPEDLRAHVFIIGTGAVPNEILLRLAEQRIRAREGLAILDSGGQLAEQALMAVPRARTDDLVAFFPGQDQERPISINPLDGIPPESHDQVAADVVEALQSVYATSWGPRTDWLCYVCARTLISHPTGSLVEISKLLTSQRYRTRALEHVSPDIRAFWDNEFAAYTKGQRGDMISPILNKIGRLHANPVLKEVLSGRKTVDPRDILNYQRIFIANLHRGTLRRVASTLLGSFLTTWFLAAAMERTADTEHPPFSLFINNVTHVATTSLIDALSDADQHGLSLIVSSPTLIQMSEELRAAVLKVGTVIAFRVGIDDAELLERVFNRRYQADEFTALEEGEMLIRTMRAGKTETFRAQASTPTTYTHRRRANLLDVSRRKYGRRRETVEEEVRRQIT